MRLGGEVYSDWLFRAMTYWKLGEKSQANELFERAVSG